MILCCPLPFSLSLNSTSVPTNIPLYWPASAAFFSVGWSHSIRSDLAVLFRLLQAKRLASGQTESHRDRPLKRTQPLLVLVINITKKSRYCKWRTHRHSNWLWCETALSKCRSVTLCEYRLTSRNYGLQGSKSHNCCCCYHSTYKTKQTLYKKRYTRAKKNSSFICRPAARTTTTTDSK